MSFCQTFLVSDVHTYNTDHTSSIHTQLEVALQEATIMYFMPLMRPPRSTLLPPLDTTATGKSVDRKDI